MKVKKTTYEVEGSIEPCYEVSSDDNSIMVRIATCYHYIGKNSLYVTEYIDGDFNSREEIDGDFKSLTSAKALQIAQSNSVYLY